MIAMLDTSESLDTCQIEIGCEVAQLLTPLTRFKRQNDEGIFGIDNGMYSRTDISGWLALLLREKNAKAVCRFVTLPDIVGSARRTLELFDIWRYRSELSGWPIALVAQDGQEDLPIPWGATSAVFVGGSTDWKMGKHAADIIKTAKILGLWVHVGRVNTPDRWDHFEQMGVDSCDGSGLARYSWMRERIRDRKREPQQELQFEEME